MDLLERETNEFLTNQKKDYFVGKYDQGFVKSRAVDLTAVKVLFEEIDEICK